VDQKILVLAQMLPVQLIGWFSEVHGETFYCPDVVESPPDQSHRRTRETAPAERASCSLRFKTEV
jgi:hypothetical protein